MSIFREPVGQIIPVGMMAVVNDPRPLELGVNFSIATITAPSGRQYIFHHDSGYLLCENNSQLHRECVEHMENVQEAHEQLLGLLSLNKDKIKVVARHEFWSYLQAQG